MVDITYAVCAYYVWVLMLLLSKMFINDSLLCYSLTLSKKREYDCKVYLMSCVAH